MNASNMNADAANPGAAIPASVTQALTPTKVLILALGGEGGAVMADWLVDALLAAGYPVQATSVPGVAQRTGATSYYIEFLPVQRERLEGAEPVFCLSPAAGQIDVLVSSELLETGRAIERGLVSPDTTTLISSTSRFLTVLEKMQMADGRFDAERIVNAARALSKSHALFDMAQATTDAGTIISSVMFGALAASGRLPLTRTQCEAVVGAAGRGAQASLRGFAMGFDICQAILSGDTGDVPAETSRVSQQTAVPAETSRSSQRFTTPELTALPTASMPGTSSTSPNSSALTQVLSVNLPASVAQVAALGVARLIDYQDEAYARSYLLHVERFVAAERLASTKQLASTERLASTETDYSVSRTAARFLALWMAYEDVIRVADLKSRATRFARIRDEFGAGATEPVVVRDFLKPGVEEVAAILPAVLAKRLLAWAERRGMKTFSDGLRLQTSSIAGLAMMRTLAALRRWRRKSSRFQDEQQLIERWSQTLLAALALNAPLAREIAECPRLIKGYSDTFARGRKSFMDILENLIEPKLGIVPAPALANSIKRAREAAMEDPAGRALALTLGLPLPEPKVQPIRFMPMKRPKV
jgi:indolepyruvate ferredoxin oxidoreductase, beta subunit